MWYTPWTIKTFFFASQHFFPVFWSISQKFAHKFTTASMSNWPIDVCANAVVQFILSIHDWFISWLSSLQVAYFNYYSKSIMLLFTWPCNFRTTQKKKRGMWCFQLLNVEIELVTSHPWNRVVLLILVPEGRSDFVDWILQHPLIYIW